VAIALRSAGTALEETTATTSHPVPYPATISAGDVMVLGIGTSSANSAAISTPSGWTLIRQSSSTGNTLLPSIAAYVTVATGSETGNLTVTSGSIVIAAQILAFSGVDQTTPQDVTAGFVDQTALQTNMDIPAITIATSGAALIAMGSKNSGTATATPPTSPGTFTETTDHTTGNRAFEMSYLLGVSSGSTGTVTITWSATSRGLGVLVALRPAATSFELLTPTPRYY
jgi:hypothetical protein